MPANKQPFYHRATFNFTTTTELTQEEVQDLFEKALKRRKGFGYVEGTLDTEEWDEPLPGDPADLMG